MARLTSRSKAHQVLRTAVIIAGKRFPAVLMAARKTVTVVRGWQYRAKAARIPVDPSIAVFESFSGRTFSDSPRGIFRALLASPEQFGVTTLVWALPPEVALALADRGYDVRGIEPFAKLSRPAIELDRLFGEDALEELRGATIVPWGSDEYRRWYARAGLWVANCRLPAYLLTREGQTFIQAWHGTPLKRLGCDIDPTITKNAVYSTRELHRVYSFEGRRLAWLLTQSPFASEKLGTAFDLVRTGRSSAIIEQGYPRNDALFTFTPEDVARIRTRLGVPDGKKIVLYAPTWRDDQHSSGVGYTYKTEADFDALRAALGDDYVILFRAHYLIANAFDFASYGGFVLDVSKVDDINDLYVVSDVLVTDYSSVFFDYANLGRPIVFFMYDLDMYAGEMRGFYLGLDELPGLVVRTTAELIDAVRAAEHPSEAERTRLETFRRRFTALDDGHASERVISRMLVEGALHPLPGGVQA